MYTSNYYACECGVITHNKKKNLKCIDCKSDCINLFTAPTYFYNYICSKCGNTWKSSTLCSHQSKCKICKCINGLSNGLEFEIIYNETKNVINLIRAQRDKLYSQVDPKFKLTSKRLKDKIVEFNKKNF